MDDDPADGVRPTFAQHQVCGQVASTPAFAQRWRERAQAIEKIAEASSFGRGETGHAFTLGSSASSGLTLCS